MPFLIVLPKTVRKLTFDNWAKKSRLKTHLIEAIFETIFFTQTLFLRTFVSSKANGQCICQTGDRLAREDVAATRCE